ncbi:MAG: cytochrome c biogenesis protein CcsA [Armatimonadetes bacterium]|nr:cytochrome c biogenesis protein CcsA [Armatimonadota bacterium]
MDEFALELHRPPSWSLALGDIGRGSIYAAIVFFFVAAVAWVFFPKLREATKVGSWAFGLGCASILSAFATLTTLFVTNRFEFAYVWAHGDATNALQYRIAAVWSGQQGSFLLWATAAAVWALLTAHKTQVYRRWYTVATSFVLGGLASILAFESPFNLNLVEGKPFVPEAGQGLAPSLLNYWVVIHPPVIFLGFAALTALFALGFAAMLEQDRESWVPIVRPWAITAMSVLGLGLCMGGFWAYETLGWGGFWMWDPVENVSFVPWVLSIALVHGLLVQRAKHGWQASNFLLAGLPFLTFVYGTFLTRSGMLSQASVHSFAEMESNALKLLLILMGSTVLGYVGTWAVRAIQAAKKPEAVPAGTWANRKGWYLMGNLLLAAMGVATLIGMSVPFIQAVQGKASKVVEETLYHQVLSWVFVPLMFVMAVGPFMSWKGSGAKEIGSRVYTILCFAIGIAGTVILLFVLTPFKQIVNFQPEIHMPGGMTVNGLAWIMFLLTVCSFALVGNVWKVTEKWKRSKMGSMPYISHIGIAVLMTGLIMSRGMEQKGSAVVATGHPGQVLGYNVVYRGQTSDIHDRQNQAVFDVYDAKNPEKLLFTAKPGLYEVTMGDGQTTNMVWPAIKKGPFHDVYFSLGQPQRFGQDISLPEMQSTAFGGAKITYLGMTRQGEFGQPGTTFTARIQVEKGGEVEVVEPKMQVGGADGAIRNPVTTKSGLTFEFSGMNVAAKAVNLRVDTDMMVFPVDIFHKPLTSLVWFGTGIMTLAGLLSAYAARVPKPARVKEPEPERGRQVGDRGLITTT